MVAELFVNSRPLSFPVFIVFSQLRLYTVASDSVELKSFDTNGSMLILHNSTKDTSGFLYNNLNNQKANLRGYRMIVRSFCLNEKTTNDTRFIILCE